MPQTKRAQREVAKLLGVPDVIAMETSAQLDVLNGRFINWLRNGVIPIVDEQMDDHAFWMEELKTKLQEDDAREKAQAVKWDEVRDLLFGWEEELAPLQAQLPELRMFGWKPGTSPLEAMQQAAIQQAQMAFQQAQANYGIQADQYMVVAKQALEMGQQPPPEPPMPQPMPPAPVPYVNPAPLKPALQHVILWLWEDMLLREGMQVSPELRTYMWLRAVWEHYRKLATAAAMPPAAPEMGAPPPAPGPAGPQPLAPQAVAQVPVAA